MSGIASLLLLSAATCLALATFKARILRAVLLAIAAMLPPLMALIAVNSESPAFGDVRVRLEGVSLKAPASEPAGSAAPARPLRIGGEAAVDDLVIDGLPAGAASFDPSGLLRAFPLSEPLLPKAGRRASAEAAAASVARNGDDLFLGAYPIGPADSFCVESCSAPDARWFRLSPDRARLVAGDGSGDALPDFRTRPLVHYRPSQNIFPLRDYGRRWNGPLLGAADVCHRRFLCDRSTAQPVKSFLFWNGGSTWLKQPLYLAMLDEGAVLQRADGSRLRMADASAKAPSTTVANREEITVWQVSYAPAYVNILKDRRPSHLIARQIFVASLQEGSAGLRFKRQPTLVVRQQDVRDAGRRLRSRGMNTPVVLNIVGASALATSVPASALHLEQIGGSAAGALTSMAGAGNALVFGREFTEPPFDDDILPQVGAERSQRLSAPQRLVIPYAATDPAGAGRTVAVSVDRYTFPRLLLPVLAFWALLFAFLQWSLWSGNPTALALTLVLQVLLLLRVLVAIGAAALDPQINPYVALSQALLAYCLLPYAFAWAFGGPGRSPLVRLPGALALLALAAILFRGGGINKAWLELTLVVALGSVLIPLAARARRRPVEPRSSRWAALSTKAAAVPRAIRRRIRRGGLRVVRAAALVRLSLPGRAGPWILLAAGLVAARLLLLMLGHKERWGIAFSAWYLPLSLIVCAGLLASLDPRRPRQAAGLFLAYFGTAAILFAGLPYGLSDKGFPLVHFPPVLALSLAFIPATLALWQKSLFRIPGALALAMVPGFVVIAATASPAAAPPPAAAAEGGVDKQAILKRLDSLSDTQANSLRFYAPLRPAALNEIGSEPGERMRRWRYLLANFTEDGRGRGFPLVADVSDLRPVQADDNLAAIHLIAPFGRSAAAMLIVLLGIAGLVGARAFSRRRTGDIAAQLALWTLFAAALYMILANLVLVPFTGRNIYLLAALSNSDLLEGAALFALAFAQLAGEPAERLAP
jgi:hypothetical protein